MVTCNDCIHRCVCPIADGCEYADEQHIRDDCEYFAPTADVVPKSEVERLVDLNKQLEIDIVNANMNLDHITHELEIVKREVAREIFEEIEKRSSMWGGERHINYKVFAELKKKYTE